MHVRDNVTFMFIFSINLDPLVQLNWQCISSIANLAFVFLFSINTARAVEHS